MKLQKTYEKTNKLDKIEKAILMKIMPNSTGWDSYYDYVNIFSKRTSWRLKKISIIPTGRLIYKYIIIKLNIDGILLHELDYRIESEYFNTNNIDLDKLNRLIKTWKPKALAFDAAENLQ